MEAISLPSDPIPDFLALSPYCHLRTMQLLKVLSVASLSDGAFMSWTQESSLLGTAACFSCCSVLAQVCCYSCCLCNLQFSYIHIKNPTVQLILIQQCLYCCFKIFPRWKGKTHLVQMQGHISAQKQFSTKQTISSGSRRSIRKSWGGSCTILHNDRKDSKISGKHEWNIFLSSLFLSPPVFEGHLPFFTKFPWHNSNDWSPGKCFEADLPTSFFKAY